MKHLAVLLFLAGGFATAASTHVWWLTVQIAPMHPTYRGVPVAKLSAALKRLSPLSCDPRRAQFTADQCRDITRYKMRFRLADDFNQDGRRDIAETAVGELSDGTRVRLLIISESADPMRSRAFMDPGTGFSVIHQAQGSLFWFPCMECDHYTEIRWDPTQNAYVELQPEHERSPPAAHASPVDNAER